MGIDFHDWMAMHQLASKMGYQIISDAEQAHQLWLQKKTKGNRMVTADLKLLSILTGFSTAAVARSIRGSSPAALKPTDAKRVRRLAQVLQYRTPTRLPREWTGREIAVATELLGKPSFSFHEDIIRSITRGLKPTNGRLTIYDLSDGVTRYQFFKNPPNLLDSEGLILVNTQATPEEITQFAHTYPVLPIVLIHDNPPGAGGYPNPVIANIFPNLDAADSGFRLMLQHVFDKQKVRNPVLAMVDPENVETRKLKLKVFNEECAKASVTPNVYTEMKEYTVEAGVNLVEEVRSRFPQKIDAFIVLSDTAAVGVYSQVRDDDPKVVVTGFDNSQLARAFNLSSVDQGLESAGSSALAILESSIKEWRASGFRPDPTEVPVTVLPAIRDRKDP